MALLYPYCTVAQLQAEIENVDSALTAQLELAINSASRYIDRYKGRDYYQHDHTVNALQVWPSSNAIYGEELFLPYWPVISLSQVLVAQRAWVENTDYVRPSAKPWLLVAINGLDWSTGWGILDVLTLTGKFGYVQAAAADVPTGLPEQINQACILLAAAFSGHNRKEVVSVTGQKEEIMTKDIPRAVYDLLGARRTLI